MIQLQAYPAFRAKRGRFMLGYPVPSRSAGLPRRRSGIGANLTLMREEEKAGPSTSLPSARDDSSRSLRLRRRSTACAQDDKEQLSVDSCRLSVKTPRQTTAITATKISALAKRARRGHPAACAQDNNSRSLDSAGDDSQRDRKTETRRG